VIRNSKSFQELTMAKEDSSARKKLQVGKEFEAER